MLALIAGLFGLILGSFLNVVILRKGVRGLGGRSNCPQCGTEIAAYDLIPVISWLYLRGRCRHCGSRISIQYPLVEAATAIAFALIAGAPGAANAPLQLALSLTIAALLICICAYDLRHTIIPDAWAWPFGALALALSLVSHGDMNAALPALVAGPVAAFPLFFLWAVSKGKWMGFGDVKLALGMGWLLGAGHGIFAVFLGFVIGSIVLVPLMYGARLVTHMRGYATAAAGLTMRSEVPFGPFLIASTFLVWISLLYGYDIAGLIGW